MKILITGISLFLSLAAVAAIAGNGPDAPAELERESYRAWLETIGSTQSPYFDSLVDWYEEQRDADLPAPVEADPDRLYVTVERPLQQAIEAEEMGDVEEGVTYGLETYGIIDAPVNTVLEAILFRWGKPVGEVAGMTYPVDTVYGYRQEVLQPHWGATAYRTQTTLRNGGVAKDQHDTNTLVVRGNSETGYLIIGGFFGPNGKTATTSSMSVMLLKPMADGRTDYRVSGRYTGQSYLTFGRDFGRRNFGFNLARIRAGQKDFYGNVAELKATGKITERRPAIF